MKDKKSVLFKILVILGVFSLVMTILSIFTKKPKIEANKPRETMKMLNYDHKGYITNDNLLPSNYLEVLDFTDERSTTNRYYLKNKNPIILKAGNYNIVYTGNAQVLTSTVSSIACYGLIYYVYDINNNLIYTNTTNYLNPSTNQANNQPIPITDRAKTTQDINGYLGIDELYNERTQDTIVYARNANYRDEYKLYIEIISGSGAYRAPVDMTNIDLGIYKINNIDDMSYYDNKYYSSYDIYLKRFKHLKSGLTGMQPIVEDYNSNQLYISAGESSDYEKGYQIAIEATNTRVQTAYNRGYTQGQQDANLLNYNEYYEQGRQDGYIEGRRDGYEDGVRIGENGNLKDMIESVVDTPLNIIYSLLNFNILGVNIWGFITSLLSILILIFVIKKLRH